MPTKADLPRQRNDFHTMLDNYIGVFVLDGRRDLDEEFSDAPEAP